MLHLILIILTKQIQWCHWWCHGQTLMPMTSHDQYSYVVSPFHHLNPTSGMVSLMTLLASCDTDNSMNCITWPKYHAVHCFNSLDLANKMVPWQFHQYHMFTCFTSFWSLWHIECNGAIDNMIGITQTCLDIV